MKEEILRQMNIFIDKMKALSDMEYEKGRSQLEITDHIIERYFEEKLGSTEKLINTDYFDGNDFSLIGKYSTKDDVEIVYQDILRRKQLSLIKIAEEIKIFGVEGKIKQFLKKSGGQHTLNIYFWKYEGTISNYFLLTILIVLFIIIVFQFIF